MVFPENLQKEFGPDLLREMESLGKLIHLKEGDSFMEPGNPVNAVPLVLKGSLKVSRPDESGKDLLLYYINSSETCAMSFTCCMQTLPSEVKATAETEVELLAIPLSCMDDWFTRFPAWKAFVMRSIRFRFQEMLNAIDQLAFQRLDERLIHFLREKSRTSGSRLINLSHEQIAQELASSREVISRLLKKLENDGRVLLYRNQVKLLGEM
jgi:CRP/FNR family transcriptional regulator